MAASKPTGPSWSYPVAGAPSRGDTLRPGDPAATAASELKDSINTPAPQSAEDFVACARHVWNQDRALAARHLFEALRLVPNHPWANHGLAEFFFDAGLLPDALEYSARAVEAAPDDLEFASLRLLLLDAHGMTDDALRLLSHHVDAGRNAPELAMMFARLAPRTHREGEAIQRIEEALATPSLSPPQCKALHMYAAGLLDRMGRYDDAFDHARRGHKAYSLPYDPHAFRREMNEQMAWYTPERLASLPKATHGWTQPIFIVGMPRSGTSLVEQILDRHPEVCGAGELPDLTHVVRRMAMHSGDTRAFLQSATPQRLDGAAGLYQSRVVALAPNARYITDKQPFNWMRLGSVSRLFPESRVIHVVRDPLDTCLSCYLTHFNDSVTHASDLTHLGMNYVDQARTMAHWRRVLELPILEVSYELLVAEPQVQVRRMLEFLNLSWDEGCVRFHESERGVGTASMHQVRRPLYSSSVGRWRNYQRHLSPLREALAETPPAAAAEIASS